MGSITDDVLLAQNCRQTSANVLLTYNTTLVEERPPEPALSFGCRSAKLLRVRTIGRHWRGYHRFRHLSPASSRARPKIRGAGAVPELSVSMYGTQP